MKRVSHSSWLVSPWLSGALALLLLLVSFNYWSTSGQNNILHLRNQQHQTANDRLASRLSDTSRLLTETDKEVKVLQQAREDLAKCVREQVPREDSLPAREQLRDEIVGLREENSVLKTKVKTLESDIVQKDWRSTELGKRLNMLRDQFGREQAAGLEETYKFSQEAQEGGGEEKVEAAKKEGIKVEGVRMNIDKKRRKSKTSNVKSNKQGLYRTFGKDEQDSREDIDSIVEESMEKSTTHKINQSQSTGDAYDSKHEHVNRKSVQQSKDSKAVGSHHDSINSVEETASDVKVIDIKQNMYIKEVDVAEQSTKQLEKSKPKASRNDTNRRDESTKELKQYALSRDKYSEKLFFKQPEKSEPKDSHYNSESGNDEIDDGIKAFDPEKDANNKDNHFETKEEIEEMKPKVSHYISESIAEENNEKMKTDDMKEEENRKFPSKQLNNNISESLVSQLEGAGKDLLQNKREKQKAGGEESNVENNSQYPLPDTGVMDGNVDETV